MRQEGPLLKRVKCAPNYVVLLQYRQPLKQCLLVFFWSEWTSLYPDLDSHVVAQTAHTTAEKNSDKSMIVEDLRKNVEMHPEALVTGSKSVVYTQPNRSECTHFQSELVKNGIEHTGVYTLHSTCIRVGVDTLMLHRMDGFEHYFCQWSRWGC